MIEVTRTARVGEDGMIHIPVPEFAPGSEVSVTIRTLGDLDHETADSNPDVEDFA